MPFTAIKPVNVASLTCENSLLTICDAAENERLGTFAHDEFESPSVAVVMIDGARTGSGVDVIAGAPPDSLEPGAVRNKTPASSGYVGTISIRAIIVLAGPGVVIVAG